MKLANNLQHMIREENEYLDKNMLLLVAFFCHNFPSDSLWILIMAARLCFSTSSLPASQIAPSPIHHSLALPALHNFPSKVDFGVKMPPLEPVLLRRPNAANQVAMAQSVYRALLKALRRNVSTDPKKSHFKEFIAAEFRSHARITDEVVIKKKLDLARDYASLVIGVHNHKDLLLSYNIAVDRTEEEKRRLQNTAERVGLQLPKVYKEEENQL